MRPTKTDNASPQLCRLNLGMLRFLIAGLVLSLPLLAAAETTREIRMRVVESATGKPVAGAQVRYRATASEGTFTGHGGRTGILFDIRAESDANGTIAIPPTKFDARIFGVFGMNTNYENARMTITRRGYESLELRNSLRIIPQLDEVISWEHNGRTVELRPVRDATGQPVLDHAEENPVSPRKPIDRWSRQEPPSTIRK